MEVLKEANLVVIQFGEVQQNAHLALYLTKMHAQGYSDSSIHCLTYKSFKKVLLIFIFPLYLAS